MLKAILVTGSRDWTSHDLIKAAFDSEEEKFGSTPTVLLHGDCRGADLIAAKHGKMRTFWQVIPMPAQWNKLGKLAGPRRNAEMLKVLTSLQACGYDCKVLAFPKPSSKGTWDMVNKARIAGFDVVIHQEK